MSHFSVLGLDLAKNSFSFVVLDSTGKCLKRQTVTRSRLLKVLLKSDVDKVAMEACSSAHYWARVLIAHGLTVELLPPQYVKGYLRGQKNDSNDALAIAEACQHGKIRPVRVKAVEDQDRQAFIRIRERLKGDQTKLVNQMRGLLSEYGLVMSKGLATFRKQVPLILEDAENGLTPTFRELLYRRYQQFLAIAEELSWYNQKLLQAVKEDPDCQRLQTLPGVGPVVAYTLKDWMGDGLQFRRGRDASAALGVVPKQYSTGGRSTLLGISKRGNATLRANLVHGARAVVTQAIRQKKTDRLSLWLRRLEERRGFNKAVVALVNKLVRMAWVLMTKQQVYAPAEA